MLSVLPVWSSRISVVMQEIPLMAPAATFFDAMVKLVETAVV